MRTAVSQWTADGSQRQASGFPDVNALFLH